MKRIATWTIAVACAGGLALLHALRQPAEHEGHAHLAALQQTLLTVESHQPLRPLGLIDDDGTAFAPERLQGRWSLVFFGFTSCPHVCPMTLQVLGSVAQDPASGVPAQTTQIVFVSVDPARDTPARIKHYLAQFGGRMVGLTGTRDAIDRLGVEIGAGYAAFASGIDHSTSLFAVDPKGRLAGVLLRPNDPAGIVADLVRLQSSYGSAEQASLAR